MPVSTPVREGGRLGNGNSGDRIRKWYLQPLPQGVFAADSFSKRVQQGSSEGVSNPMSRPRSAMPDRPEIHDNVCKAVGSGS